MSSMELLNNFISSCVADGQASSAQLRNGLSYSGRRLVAPVSRALRARRNHKAQSAMEYLMTYGWTILIIAVVIGALFSLGIFGGTSYSSSSCVTVPGFSCQSPTLTTSGLLTFSFGQAGVSSSQTGSALPLYNVQFECAATSGSNGLPNPIAFNGITPAGGLTLYSSSSNSLASSQALTISALPCYTSAGSALGSQPIGTTFSGFLWINYTAQAVAQNPATNPWITVKASTLKTKVV